MYPPPTVIDMTSLEGKSSTFRPLTLTDRHVSGTVIHIIFKEDAHELVESSRLFTMYQEAAEDGGMFKRFPFQKAMRCEF